MEQLFEQAKETFESNRLDEARSLLDLLIGNQTCLKEALLLRSLLFRKLQLWGDAINDLNRILELDPDNKVALNHRTMVLQIIRFWNKEMSNP